MDELCWFCRKAFIKTTALLFVLNSWVSGVGAQTSLESRLPILHFAASHDDIPDEPKIRTTLRVIDNPGGLNRLDGPTRDYQGAVAIERRGSTSQFLFPKIGYGFELKGQNGEDSSASLLGMPEEEDWVLHGPYSDKSLIHNAFAYTLARTLHPGLGPRCRLVELVTGDDYRGVYLLVESIKRDNNRIDIARLDPDENSGEAMTGGYILKIDKETGDDDPSIQYGFELPPRRLGGMENTRVRFHYPSAEDISPQQAAYIQDYMESFEASLAASDIDELDAGYLSMIDLPSFVDYFLVNEVMRNLDGYRLSTYFYKDRDRNDSRLHMGQVWDYNLSLGNGDYCEGWEPEGWAFRFQNYCPDDGYQPPFWYTRLFESLPFRIALKQRYTALRSNGPLSNAMLRSRIDSLSGHIGAEAINRNFERWPVLGQWVWPNFYVAVDHQDAIRYAWTFLEQRMAWMDAEIAKLEDPGFVDGDQMLLYPNPGDGTDVRVIGQGPTDFPLSYECYDSLGRLIHTGTVDSPQQPIEIPGQHSFIFYKLRNARGEEGQGTWLRISR